jgi:redox-sensing transcriptional repressor
MASKNKNIIYTEGVINRLSQYLRHLVQLKEEGKRTVTSNLISKSTGINSAEVRRDLVYFGIKGKRGVGFNIDELINSFNKILGYESKVRIVLVGAGNLGKAILNYKMLGKYGFSIEDIFDNNLKVIGNVILHHTVKDISLIESVIKSKKIDVAILAVSQAAAQEVTDILVDSGIKVIINYTSVNVYAPPGINIQTTDPIEKLLHTLYYLSRTGYCS